MNIFSAPNYLREEIHIFLENIGYSARLIEKCFNFLQLSIPKNEAYFIIDILLIQAASLYYTLYLLFIMFFLINNHGLDTRE